MKIMKNLKKISQKTPKIFQNHLKIREKNQSIGFCSFQTVRLGFFTILILFSNGISMRSFEISTSLRSHYNLFSSWVGRKERQVIYI